MPAPLSLDWVVLTTGNRPEELAAAVRSISDSRSALDTIIVVANGADVDVTHIEQADGLIVLRPGENLGVPGGRHHAAMHGSGDVVCFLDDDAELPLDACDRLRSAFAADARLGAAALRLVDENGRTSQRHVPRRGARDATTSGPVALFLGGAAAIRRSAYESVGGYFTELGYGHEEVELCWRLIDAEWEIEYLADVQVFHPRTEISRHAAGWHLTGRNRVWIARRTLPAPVAAVHVLAWLVAGIKRAPAGCRRDYVRGWLSGWRGAIERSPISWSGVVRLARLGRPPIF